jgi:hypothetical protein
MDLVCCDLGAFVFEREIVLASGADDSVRATSIAVRICGRAEWLVAIASQTELVVTAAPAMLTLL